jgi:general nucleoside transport system permease protein
VSARPLHPPWPRVPRGLWLPLAAVTAATCFGALLVVATGVPLADAAAAFADGAWGSGYAVGASVNRALAIGLVGLGFIVAQRANLTNVGGEGQIAVGGIAAAAMSLYGGAGHLPAALAFALPMLVASLAGAAWGAIAGGLKVRFGTNEVISTLLLSFIGIWLLYGCVQSEALLRQPMTTSATLPESLEIPENTRLPQLFANADVPLHIGLPLAVLLCIVVAVVINRTVFGTMLRAVGANPDAARRAGMPIAGCIVLAMAIAGAFGGLAGALMLQGEQWTCWHAAASKVSSRARCCSASCAQAASTWSWWPACRARSSWSSRA